MAMTHLIVYHLGTFFHCDESFSVLYRSSYCDLGPNFLLTFLLSNTCLDLDTTNGYSHSLDFLTCVGPRIIIVQTKSVDFLFLMLYSGLHFRRAIRLATFSADNRWLNKPKKILSVKWIVPLRCVHAAPQNLWPCCLTQHKWTLRVD